MSRYAFSVPAGEVDLGKIAQSGQAFRWKQLDGGAYAVPLVDEVATVSWNGQALIIEGTSLPRKAWHAYFDLATDYAELRQRFAREGGPLVEKAVSVSCGLRSLNQPFFEGCISALTSQNSNIPKIMSSLERLCAGGSFPTAGEILERLEEDDCSLGYRIGYIREFCTSYLDGRWQHLKKLSPFERAMEGLNPLKPGEKPPLEEVIRDLTQAKGIGPKVANIIALFSLGYDDAIPRDVWINRCEEAGISWDIPYGGLEQQLVFYAAVNGFLGL